MIVFWVLLVWLVLAVPFGVVVGRGIRAGLAPVPPRDVETEPTRLVPGVA